MTFSDYHTHTVFCDGRDTPEEMAEEALRRGLDELGFSGHSYTFFDESFCMSKEGTKQYQQRVRSLQRRYEGKLKILLGVEQDYFSEEPTDSYDYVIGSVHYIRKDGFYLPIDESREKQIEIAARFYGGDFYSFAEDYYALMADVYRRTKCDIIGHFDLITKFNEDQVLFDTGHPRYMAAAERALETLMETPAVFEINTGAISRGYRSEPYPERWIAERLKRAGKKLVINSDAHAKEWLREADHGQDYFSY